MTDQLSSRCKFGRNLSRGGRTIFDAHPLAVSALSGSLVMLLTLFVTPSAADLTDVLSQPPQTRINAISAHESGPEALDIIKARGFIGELYNIRSQDGAILSVYHIINPLADPRTLNKFPVMINHGVIGDAAQMMGHSETASPRRPVIGQIVADPSDTCMAFFLANNNFDVWMVDNRGTSLANHRASDDLGIGEGAKFWNFTLDDEILKDLPATIDFVLSMTHQPKLHYFGFSESTLFMFCLLSMKPYYADKLASYVALAPVAYIDNISGTALTAFMPSVVIPDSVNGNYVPQLLIDTGGSALRSLCQTEVAKKTVCAAALGSLSGVGPDALSNGIFATTFKGTSIKAIKHFMQLYSQKRLGMYDHGTEKNMRLYGQPTPPDYDLRNIRLPYIILFRGDRDLLSDVVDQARLLRTIGVKPYLDFHYSNYDHLDFLVGKTIVQDVNVPAGKAILKLLKLQTLNTPHGFVRDPVTVLLPRPARPVSISIPDGNRRLEIRNDLVHNLVNAVVETVEDSANGKGVLPAPLAPVVPPIATNALRVYGDQVDKVSSEISKVGDILNIGSVSSAPV